MGRFFFTLPGREREAQDLSGLAAPPGARRLGAGETLRRLGVLGLVAFAFAMVAVIVVNAPH